MVSPGQTFDTALPSNPSTSYRWNLVNDLDANLIQLVEQTYVAEQPVIPGSPNYGYDAWLTVDESLQADGEARIIDFPGGLYAVTRMEVKNPGEDIPGAWQKLVKWMESSRYHHGRHQWLEEHIGPLGEMGGDPPFTLDLHLPINE